MKKYIFLMVALLATLGVQAQSTIEWDVTIGDFRYKLYDNYKACLLGASTESNLTGTVVIPSSVDYTYNEVSHSYTVTELDSWYCNNVVSLTLPETMTNITLNNIGSEVETLTLPTALTTVTVNGQVNVKEFAISEDNPTFSVVDGVLFNKTKTTLFCYPRNRPGVKYEIPASVKNIAQNAFRSHPRLETIVLPEGLTDIDNNAFSYISTLNKCNFPETLLKIDNEAFRDCKIVTTDNTFTLPPHIQTIGTYAFNSAFFDNNNVTVVFPSTLGESGSQLTVGYEAFNCNSIRSEMTDPVHSSDGAFNGVRTIYIPYNTKDTYKAKYGWKDNESKLRELANPETSTVEKVTIQRVLDFENKTVKVKFSTETEGATIRYKIVENDADENSDPNTWRIYEGGIEIEVTSSVWPYSDYTYYVKAVAIKEGMNTSPISTMIIHYNSLSTPAPSIDCIDGASTMIMSTADKDISIYYTKDGTTPTSNSTPYTGQIPLDGNFQYRAIAYKEGYFPSYVVDRYVGWFSCKNPQITYEAIEPSGNEVLVTVTAQREDESLMYQASSGDFLPYTAPVKTTRDSYFYAYAVKDNYNNSETVSRYLSPSEIRSHKPKINIDQDTKALTLTVDEEGYDIYYTLDNTTPEVKEKFLYTDPIVLGGNCTIRAIAHKAGLFQSEEASTTIDNWFEMAEVTMSQEVVNGQPVMKLECETEGATIVYSYNGFYEDYTYNQPFAVAEGQAIYAKAKKSGFLDSEWKEFRLDYSQYERCQMPSWDYDNWTHQVTLNSEEEGAEIYYVIDTNDSQTPTTASTKYTGPFVPDKNGTLKWIAAKEGKVNSSVSQGSLEDVLRLHSVTFDPVIGEGENQYKMMFSYKDDAINWGVDIYYWYDGIGATKYTTGESVTVPSDRYVYAEARKEGYPTSYSSSFYVVRSSYVLEQPIIQPDIDSRKLIVTGQREGVTIYYTNDGTDPTEETTNKLEQGNTDIYVDHNCTYKFLAVKEGMINAPISEFAINDWFQVPQVKITPRAQVWDAADEKVMVDITVDGGYDIYWEYDGNQVMGSVKDNIKYESPISIEYGRRITASAYKEGYNSNWVTTDWIYRENYSCNSPEVSIGSDLMVKMVPSNEGDKIRYTLDGSNPTRYNGTEYKEPFKLEKNATIKAVAYREDRITSNISERYYDGYQVARVTITPYADNNKFMCKMETATPNATIYYALNSDQKNNITENTRYNGPFEITNGSRISASAALDGYRDADWTGTDWYYDNELRCSTPTVSVTDTVVTITGSANVKLYYTLDGSEPTVYSPEYKAPFRLERNATIKAIAAADGFLNSSVYETDYRGYRVKDVQFNPYAANNEKLMVALECEDKDAVIYYTIGEGYNSEDITAEPNLRYSSPVEIKDGQRIFASAAKDGYLNATWRNSDNIWKYMVTANQPNVNIDDDATVSITVTGEPGAKIYYTTDGTTPNMYSSTEYKEPFKLVKNGEVRAITVVDNKFNSNYSNNWYNGFQVYEVVFTPVVNNGVLKMQLSSATPDVTFYYIINDYTDYIASATKYTGPFQIPDGAYVYAKGTRDGYNETGWQYSDYVYYSNYRTNTPTVAIKDTVVTITGVEGATLYYTLDGSEPTPESTKYTEPFKLTKNASVKAIALAEGMLPSNTRERYFSEFYVSNVKFNAFAKDGKMMVELGCDDKDATIYYSLVGEFNDENLDGEPNVKYTTAFEVADNQQIWATAVKEGYNRRGWNDTYVYKNNITTRTPRIAINSEALVSITVTGETNPAIYYTTDGSDPTTESTKYEAAFKLEKNTEVRAIAMVDKKFMSSVTSNRFDGYRVSQVVITPIVENNTVKVKLETATPGATIYYGINEQPGYASAGMQYTAPFEIQNGAYIYASAIKDGYNDAEWSSHEWIYIDSYRCSQPSILVTDATVTMGAQDGTTLYYTLDGSDPTVNSTKYTAPFKLTKNATIRAIATMDGRLTSLVSERTYSEFRVSDVNFTLYAKDNNLMMELSCDDKDATIYYKIGDGYNASDITASPNVKYTGAFAVQEGRRVWASAAKDGYNNATWRVREDINKGAYTAGMPDIAADNDAKVTITGEGGATFYYTIDGKTPTTSSTKYTAAFKLEKNDTVKAIAVVDKKFNSEVSQYIYSGYSVETVSITPFVENNVVKVRLETATPNATIYYGINERNDKASANIRYTAPFTIKNGDRIFASATRSGYQDARWNVRNEIYYSDYTCNAPIISIDGDANVSIGSDTGATIYYTLDGSTPTTSSTQYSNSFQLTRNTTIKAMAIKSGLINSDVREMTYNDFRVANPVFAQDGTKMTITTTTPDATIYYAYGSEGGVVSVDSHKYTGTFELKDNSQLVAMAVRNGWHNSEVTQINPEKLVACSMVEAVSYDGHFLTLQAMDGATIWYTTNGNNPEDNSNNTVNWIYEYKTPIAINSTGEIKAIATKNYMNPSEIATFEINFYAGENGTKLEKSGVLEEVMAWSDLSTITEFDIEGPLNQADLAFIKNSMTSLQHLDMSKTTIEDGVLPDNAFSGLPIVSFTSPENVTQVGNGIFTNCPELAAVRWNTTTKLPDNSFDANHNPNLLLFVRFEIAAPSHTVVANQIINGTAQSIVLVDDYASNFYCPEQFYAKSIKYTHKFTMTSGNGGGWESFTLPFTPTRFIHESKGELLPFKSYEQQENQEAYRPFWLRSLNELGFEDVTTMEANKPYIICMPNNERYATRFRLAGNVTFSAADTYVPVTNPEPSEKGNVMFVPNFQHRDKEVGILAINLETVDEFLPGSAFLDNVRGLRPFEAYARSIGVARQAIRIDDADMQIATAIQDASLVDVSGNAIIKVYNLSGNLVVTGKCSEVMPKLADGVYIINGKKVVK